MMSMTLGLAPFLPEPHVLGKIRWVLGGAHGMAAIDYFDLILHGTPWLLLIIFGTAQLVHKVKGAIG